MIFERTKHGELIALGRLLNIDEETLLYCAKSSQPDITDLSQIDDRNYRSLMEMLLLFANAGGDEEEDEDEDPYEKEEREREYWEERNAEFADDAAALRYGCYD